MLTKTVQRIGRLTGRSIEPDWQARLDALDQQIRKDEGASARRALRVLVGPSFAIHPPSYALDRLLSYALRLRGIEVVPVYCDGVQRIECNYFGGAWAGGQKFKKNCALCVKTSATLWRHHPQEPLRLSRFVSTMEIERIRSDLSSLGAVDLLQHQQDGISFGHLAKDILGNSYLVGNIELIEGYEDLLRVHLENLLVVNLAYARILNHVRPDRVISNDSYYGMWAIMEHRCKARGIPFYSQYPVTKNRVAFAHDDAAMNLDFTASWPSFAKLPLSSRDNERIEHWLKGDRGYFIDATKLGGHEREEPMLGSIDLRKPTLMLAANVIWDLAALNKQVLFKDMIDWIVQTLRWFGTRSDFQLIVRPHPAEVSPQIPQTRESVASAIGASGVQVPQNVFILGADAKITLTQLIDRFDVRGMAVHTSTVGFECAALGLPVITTARSPYRGFGFTTDPDSREDYFAAIERVLNAPRAAAPDSRRELARKFIKFYQFHYYADLGLFTGNPPQFKPDLMARLKSDDGPFGYVVNSILQGLPINGSNRWLPES